MIFEFEFDYSSHGKDLGEFYFEFGDHCLFLQSREDSMPNGEIYDVIIFQGFPRNKKVRITEKFYDNMKNLPIKDCILRSGLNAEKYKVTTETDDVYDQYKMIAKKDHPNWDEENFRHYIIVVVEER